MAEAPASIEAARATLVEEEKILLGGNVTAIGKPGTLTFADTAASLIGSLTAATAYDYAISALTLYGYLNGATGHGTSDSIDETDGRTGSHTTAASGNGSKATDISWAAVRGAVAYNVFAGTSGGTKTDHPRSLIGASKMSFVDRDVPSVSGAVTLTEHGKPAARDEALRTQAAARPGGPSAIVAERNSNPQIGRR